MIRMSLQSAYNLLHKNKDMKRKSCILPTRETHFRDELISSTGSDIQRDSGNSSHCSSTFSNSNSYGNHNSHFFSNQQTSDILQKAAEIFDDGNRDLSTTELSENTVPLSTSPKEYENDAAEANAFNKAIDLNLLADDRSLQNLLVLEDYYRVQSNYFIYLQTDIRPWMRKLLANWMLEVCKNQDKGYDVFVLAMNILDRFLSVQFINKQQLQLLGTVSLLLAAKIRSSTQFHVDTLALYTADSITVEEIINWEQFVLQRLRWDVCSVTPHDILPFILNKLNLINHQKAPVLNEILSIFISYCSTEFKFSILPASMIACGCLFATLKHLKMINSKDEIETLLQNIHAITGIESECLLESVEQILELIDFLLGLNNGEQQQYSSDQNLARIENQEKSYVDTNESPILTQESYASSSLWIGNEEASLSSIYYTNCRIATN